VIYTTMFSIIMLLGFTVWHKMRTKKPVSPSS
jgi:hypothetical protein